MRQFHRVVGKHAKKCKHHAEICFWQDSVLMLAFVGASPKSFEHAMREVESMKLEIDEKSGRCHAVCVKGQSFPPPRSPNTRSSKSHPRVFYLSASSLAFSNCFKIEAELKSHRADWYLDSRIADQVPTRKSDGSQSLDLYPNSQRKVMMFEGSWRKEAEVEGIKSQQPISCRTP